MGIASIVSRVLPVAFAAAAVISYGQAKQEESYQKTC